MYWIINRMSGAVVAKATSLRRARKAVDRLDNKYGAYVHIIEEQV